MENSSGDGFEQFNESEVTYITDLKVDRPLNLN